MLIQNASILLSWSVNSDEVTSSSLLKKEIMNRKNMNEFDDKKLTMTSKRRNEINVKMSRRRRKATLVETYVEFEEWKREIFFAAHALLTSRGKNSRSIIKDHFFSAVASFNSSFTSFLRFFDKLSAFIHHLSIISRSIVIIAKSTTRQSQKAFQSLLSKCASEVMWKSSMTLAMQMTAAERRRKKEVMSATTMHRIIWKRKRVMRCFCSGKVWKLRSDDEIDIFRWRDLKDNDVDVIQASALIVLALLHNVDRHCQTG